ncbi:hypothetical protein AVEN_40067-1 [Araneus ventricosus]|uniref:Uncharacterized protein n=1 Tax=Araneus ventricosus TaxID=182803 RepID=A0A4Y2TG44_ARAVE|nr:hypothetical protein AVEN_40067-1 [Araneus ventricosus]
MMAIIEKEPPQSTKDDAPEKKLNIFDIVGGGAMACGRDASSSRCFFSPFLPERHPGHVYFAPNKDYWCARPEESRLIGTCGLEFIYVKKKFR